jgi:chromosome segregation ATPase
MKSQSFVLLFVTAALLMAGGTAYAGTKLYKWVDDKGVVHYGSVIPPEYAKQQSEQLNQQGVVVETQEAQKTPEQIAAEAKLKAEQDQAAAAAAAKDAHDKVLLDTYTSLSDMERDRKSKLNAIDAQINVLNGSITSLQGTLADLQGRSTELTGKGKPVPATLQTQIDNAQKTFVSDQQELLTLRTHKQDVNTQFDNDEARYKELTTAQPPTQ